MWYPFGKGQCSIRIQSSGENYKGCAHVRAPPGKEACDAGGAFRPMWREGSRGDDPAVRFWT